MKNVDDAANRITSKVMDAIMNILTEEQRRLMETPITPQQTGEFMQLMEDATRPVWKNLEKELEKELDRRAGKS